MMFLGVLNGILPCGLTYIAVAYTMTLKNASEGIMFMTSFGVGTLGAMQIIVALVEHGFQWNRHWTSRIKFRYISSIILFVAGVMLINRGFSKELATHRQQSRGNSAAIIRCE